MRRIIRSRPPFPSKTRPTFEVRRRMRGKWLRCSLGLHTWWLGPYTSDGKAPDENGVFVPTADLSARGYTPEWCAGWPWCKRHRLVPNERMYTRRARLRRKASS